MSIEVRQLSKRFPQADAPAVSDVSFQGPPRAITALLGPSGAGKSTVLRLVAGLEQPDAGSILIDGQDATRSPVQKRHIGLVFQSYALFQSQTVRENIGFGLAVRHLPRQQIRERVDELLELIQLRDLGERHPSELSGGQRQRVAFARALAPRPRLLLLDEPFGALDARVRGELRDWMHRLHEETSVTTLLVTHDQAEALELAQHVVLMNQGRVEQAGAPHDLYDHPENAFVASFLGGANVLSAHVQDGRAQLAGLAVGAGSDAPEGARVRAFVRPHDVKLQPAGPRSGEPAHARLDRLRRVGGYVKVALTLEGGQALSVELPWVDVESLGLVEGDHVLVDLSRARLFVEDYAI